MLLFWVIWVSLSPSERGEKALQYFNECGLNVMPHGLINIQCTSNTPFFITLCADMRVCPYVCVCGCFVFLFNSTVPLCLDSHAGKKMTRRFYIVSGFVFFSDALILLPIFFYTLRNHWQEVLHILKLQLVVFELWTHQLWLFKHSFNSISKTHYKMENKHFVLNPIFLYLKGIITSHCTTLCRQQTL